MSLLENITMLMGMLLSTHMKYEFIDMPMYVKYCAYINCIIKETVVFFSVRYVDCID